MEPAHRILIFEPPSPGFLPENKTSELPHQILTEPARDSLLPFVEVRVQFPFLTDVVLCFASLCL